jgi:hypothetical protein
VQENRLYDNYLNEVRLSKNTNSNRELKFKVLKRSNDKCREMVDKIIDFGRSIFTFRKKTYMNDVFSKYGEAEGQYTHPPQVSFLKVDYTDMVYPSYHFDLCRLAITMIDEIRYNHDDELETDDDYQNFLDFLKYLVTDKKGGRLDKEKDNFDLYVKISRDACNCLPREVIVNPFFHCYRVKKKQFPKSTYYSI